MKLHLLLFASLNALNLFAQTLTPKQEKVVRNLMMYYYGHHGRNVSLNSGMKTYIFSGQDTFYSPEGYHYVFQLKGDTAIRLDSTFYHGGNHMRYLFDHNKGIYQLGGYGLYNTNNNLEVFDLNIRRWRLEKTLGDKPSFINGIVLQNDSVLYSLFNYKSGNNVEADIFDNHIYKLNLNTFVWEKFNNINPFDERICTPFYTFNYVLAIRGNEAILINKKSLNYIVLGMQELYFDRFEFIYGIDADRIRFGKNSKLEVDLDVIWNKHKHQAKLFTLEPAWYQTTQTPELLTGLSGILLIMLLYLFWAKKNQKVFILNLAPEIISPLVHKIKMAANNTLDIDELDELLEIYHMESDSRKLKRHRLLSDLEKTNPGLIQRQKDETDKRRFIYIIKKS